MFQPQTGSFGYLAIATFIACFDLLTVFQPQTGSFGYLAKFLLVSYRHYFSVSTPNGFLRLFSQKWCLSIQVKVLTFQPQTGSFGYLASHAKYHLNLFQPCFNPKRVPSAI